MKTYKDGAYATAALSASLIALRLLIKKGVLSRDEVIRGILDEAVQRAIFAEAKTYDDPVARTTAELNRQTAEILKLMTQNL
jgi:heme exporter protein D